MNVNVPKMQKSPPNKIVSGAPILLAHAPATKLPKGTIPKEAIVSNAITRPRFIIYKDLQHRVARRHLHHYG